MQSWTTHQSRSLPKASAFHARTLLNSPKASAFRQLLVLPVFVRIPVSDHGIASGNYTGTTLPKNDHGITSGTTRGTTLELHCLEMIMGASEERARRPACVPDCPRAHRHFLVIFPCYLLLLIVVYYVCFYFRYLCLFLGILFEEHTDTFAHAASVARQALIGGGALGTNTNNTNNNPNNTNNTNTKTIIILMLILIGGDALRASLLERRPKMRAPIPNPDPWSRRCYVIIIITTIIVIVTKQ